MRRRASRLLSIFCSLFLLCWFSCQASAAVVKSVNVSPEDDEDDDNAEKKLEDEKNKVILILVDGVRWDYIKRDTTLKGFQKLAKNGVRAQHVQPVFPANSYPNWYSIATGLYPESHGFIQNNMFDIQRGDFFFMLPGDKASESHWWDKAEPFWILSERNNLNAAIYWWGGCHVAFGGVRATECFEYNGWDGLDNEIGRVREKLYTSLDKLDDGELDFVGLYFQAVDYFGHTKGPDSSETKHALSSFDRILSELQANLTAKGMDDEVNVIVVSDHGMTKTGPRDVTFVDLEPFAQDIRYQLNAGSSSMLMPEDGKTDKLFQDLFQANIEGIHLYKKENIPEDFHIRKSPLILPIWIQAEKGYSIQPLKDIRKTMRPPYNSSLGGHGYDPMKVEDMMTIFYAKGPAFKRNFVSPSLENVDYYNLLCHIFDIKCRHNNGSMARIIELLDDDDDDNEDDNDDDDDDDEDEDDNDNNDDEGDSDVAQSLQKSVSVLIWSVFVSLGIWGAR